MSQAMPHPEWVVLANRILDLDVVQLHSIVLRFLAVTDAETATTAIDEGIAMVAGYTSVQQSRRSAPEPLPRAARWLADRVSEKSDPPGTPEVTG